MRMFLRTGLIVCLSAILVSAERGCPYPEEIEPCICTDDGWGQVTLTCTKVFDTQVLLRVFDNARQIRIGYFILKESTLQYIPHQIFDDVNAKVLQMENTTLRTMFDEVPRDPGLVELDAKGVKILGGLDWKMLAAFKELRFIKIWDMPVKKLTIDYLSNVNRELLSLFCMNCEIKQLEDNVFADFFILSYLMLPQNAIVDIKRTMFPRRIQQINLEFNKISSLPDDIFSDMPFLRDVELAGNQMAVLPEDTFRPVISQLKNLDVRENPIKCDCRIAWVLQAKRGVVKGECHAPKAIRDWSFDELTRDAIRC